MMRLAFRIMFAVVTLLGVVLAIGNNLPGHWDAINNLATGRNIAEGRGFVTDVVQQLATPESLPGPETVRAPGVPYLAAALFLVFGESYALPVLAALAFVLLTALCVRQAVRESGGTWHADAAAVLVLVSHATYELRSLWNNNVLALLATFLLLVTVRHVNGRLVGWRFAVACATVASAGFLTKQTFMLGAVPFAVGLLITDTRQPVARRVAQSAVFLALFAAVTAPYWVTNLMTFGQALYSPIQGLRLPTRYGLLPTDQFHRTVRFDMPPYSYAAVVNEIGLTGLVARELRHWGTLLGAILLQNPFLVAFAVGGLVFAQLRDWRMYAAIFCLAIPPLFDSSYWIMERRYLFPIFPLVVFLAWMGTRGFRERGERRLRPATARRLRQATVGLFVAASLWAALPAARQWRWELIASRFAHPEWIEPVRRLPANAVIMAAYPPEVTWYTRRRVVIAPLGTAEDLARVLSRYQPSYYLDMEPDAPKRRVPFAEQQLASLGSGEGWHLYRIIRGEAGAVAYAAPTPGEP